MATAVHSDFILRMRDQFTRPLANAARSTTSFSRSAQNNLQVVSRSFQTLQRIGTIALAAITTGRIAAMITDFAKSGDEIAKTSRQLGLGVEALQEFRFAAERSGVSSSDLDTALRRMNVSVSDFQRRQGQLFQILRAINPSLAQQLSTVQSSEEAFTLLTEAIHQETNTARRAALAQAAFGRAGQELITMAEGGAEGLAALREEARLYGNIMSEDATTASETFQDSVTNLQATLNALKNMALLPLIEAIQPLIQSTAEYLIQNRELIGLRITDFFQSVQTAVQTLSREWESGLIPALLGGVVAFKAVTVGLGALMSIVKAVTAAKAALAVGSGVLTAVMAANPIGLIAAAAAAAVTGIILLVRNWDRLVGKVQSFLAWIRGESVQPQGPVDVWDDAFAEAMALPPDPEVTGRVHWVDEGTAVAPRGQAAAMRSSAPTTQRTEFNRDPEPTRQTYGRPVTQSTVTESRSTVEVNLNNLPAGSRIRQMGRAPGVTINTGYQDSDEFFGQDERTIMTRGRR